MRLKIRKQTWTIQDADDLADYGRCHHNKRKIEIRTKQTDKERLDTLIHEVLHAANPQFTELRVVALAGCLQVALWRDGWRRSAH